MHSRVSEEEPIQSMPPLAGAGVSHSLVRISIPVPHVTEQVQGLQSPHSPSIGAEKKRENIIIQKLNNCATYSVLNLNK